MPKVIGYAVEAFVAVVMLLGRATLPAPRRVKVRVVAGKPRG